ncbi:hypothetical protein [Labilibaculum manganireducens]|uniref:hypothetical protein n=1 Tax=Labilibaculum manganireducens TaxID=1940525 RepID=UPI0029F4F4BD|nr:hypothetical protein [Labilibaculum manganireducens]
MKRQYLFLIIISCFGLSALGQEMPNSVLNQYSIQEFGEFYNPTSRVGRQNLKTNHLYKEKLDSIIEYNYDEGTGTWNKKFIKTTYVYDENFNQILWVYSAWNAGDSNWTNLIKEESQYDEIGNSVVNTQFIWSNDHWKEERKWVYSYNQNNELIQKISYQWKYDLEDWLLTERCDYSYNAQGKPLTDSLYWWYANSQEWKLQEKVDYEYINDKELHYIFS